ncbi:hypothetical protein ISF9_080 [Microbacterium phage vB_MoxS-ISF9]|uniref:Uncharacterized protein n=1 Tax=Microbacterium phage vB_MoxS-ISF9 TaxID=1458670 RepID=W8NNM8_9CAUD|nr:hypothetical protein ISF9_080 [Microbacterium phage vB_MoxS-ISF9]AHL18550.1 hypothetical protein ISF9_080 [Microbacterium phage vB_MoxS-ISF9]
MTVEKRFKVVQSRRSGNWGILDTVASEFGVDNFALFGKLTSHDGTLPVRTITAHASRLNLGEVQRGSFFWDRRELSEFQ